MRTKLLQCADDTFLFATATKAGTKTKEYEESAENLSKYFNAHRLNINTSETELLVFSKPSKKELEELRLKLGNHILKPKASGKYIL